MSDDNRTLLEFSQDISSAEAPPTLPVGNYRASIRGAQVKESKTSGRPYIEVLFAISPDSFPADFDANFYPDGMNLAYRSISADDTPQARWRLRQTCAALGAPMGRTIDLNSWIGLETMIELNVTEFEGVVRNEVRRIVAQ